MLPDGSRSCMALHNDERNLLGAPSVRPKQLMLRAHRHQSAIFKCPSQTIMFVHDLGVNVLNVACRIQRFFKQHTSAALCKHTLSHGSVLIAKLIVQFSAVIFYLWVVNLLSGKWLRLIHFKVLHDYIHFQPSESSPLSSTLIRAYIFGTKHNLFA